MGRPAKTTYETTNWHSYAQALRPCGSLTVWFDPSMQSEAAPSGRRGRQVAEVRIRVTSLNRFTALGIPTTLAAG